MSDEWPPPGPQDQPPGGAWGPPHPPGRAPQPDFVAPTSYPRQNLLPQEVKRGRSRKPLFIGLAVVLAIIVAAVLTRVLLHDDGEDSRAAYCAALKDATANGDLSSALANADQSTRRQLRHVIDLAPSAVAGDWQTLLDAGSAAREKVDLDMLVRSFQAVRSIARDAKDNCGLQLEIPVDL